LPTVIEVKQGPGPSKSPSIMVLMSKSLSTRLLPTNTALTQDMRPLQSMAVAIITRIAASKLLIIVLVLMLFAGGFGTPGSR